MKTSVIGAVAGVILAYAAVAFTAWDWNAGSWGIEGRAFAAFVAPWLAFLGAIVGIVAGGGHDR